ncbi:MAG: NAD-dependent epimerase/dehydratase family protein, partial [Phycisphaerales bacterium]
MSDLRGKRIIVTGGAGFVGRVVLRRLMDLGVSEQAIFVPRRREFDL